MPGEARAGRAGPVSARSGLRALAWRDDHAVLRATCPEPVEGPMGAHRGGKASPETQAGTFATPVRVNTPADRIQIRVVFHLIFTLFFTLIGPSDICVIFY